jgi:hypothetical protein
MRQIFLLLLVSWVMARTAPAAEPAVSGRVLKVLPLLLNLQGHDALSPSLFERDAYQNYLRQHTNEISTVRYDVLWKASGAAATNLTVRLELRAVATDGRPVLKNLETNAPPTGYFGRWISFNLAGNDYRNLGTVVAWRATVRSGDRLLGAQQSFLW